MKLTVAHDHQLPTGVLGLALSADGAHAYVSCVDGSVHAIDPVSGKSEAFAEKHTSYASGCVLLPDGRTVISGGYDGWLMWHDTATRRCFRRVQAHRFWNWQLALSPDGRRLAAVTGQYLPGGWKYEPAPETEPSVKVFDTLTGDLVAAFTHGPPVLSCAFTHDGNHLAAANLMGDIKVWNLPGSAGGQPVSQWNTPDFSSWGTTKSHHYCGGIYGLAFSPDNETLLACGMGPMGDPMAGNGKMTWQRWDWKKGERRDQIKDGQHGTGLMETVAWHPDGTHFLMAGRQAQGTWNAALFSAADGSLVHSIDTKKRITHARFTADGKSLILTGANGQPAPKAGVWGPWGRLQVYTVEV
ncbi:MAG: repeat protein [Verrucomicrobiales bacterium]|nr:repeat protein [Verrucomicrobiales bacterium]